MTKPYRFRLALNALALAVTLGATTAMAEVQIPVEPVNMSVPNNVLRNNVPALTSSGGSGNTSARSTSPRTEMNEASNLVMAPGVNEIVPVAVSHLNRIVTPFGEPAVNTTSDATVNIEDNVIYVATNEENPVTLFITQKGSQARALSLTLVPRRIPPRELFLELEGGATNAALVGNPKAERWETSQPYIDTLRGVMRSLALGDIPQGYTLHDTNSQQRMPSCQQPGFNFQFAGGQTMVGHRLSVNIGVASNVSGQPLEFKEQSCGDWDVAAVAAWPRNVLGPNERTEVYVVRRADKKDPRMPTNTRPSLLGGL
ncbi:TraK domain-containing protein [Halomonas sp. KO116]|uniref:TraK domain-containing protein n=1 Tax=Halomonas sp. KO116 TaxID=1504981 RepID=UPI0004E416DE|nr:type-F conjugative transfer system secretin TraK [Halomonas sp. KO116]AJY53115.1 TraK family protein [Halomonas sp. KO116]